MSEIGANACQRLHPGWAAGFNYRRLPVEYFKIVSPTAGRLIDHETQQPADQQLIAAGTGVLWIGSAYTIHYSGGLWQADHVVQATDGPLAGQCLEISSSEPDRPASMQPVEPEE